MVQVVVLVGRGSGAPLALSMVAVILVLAVAVVLMFVGGVVIEYRGRLGGRITGWWNRPLPG